jgi:outer membrane protein, multidrug efflux system
MKHRLLSYVCGLLFAGLLPACNVGPNYERPKALTAASYRGQSVEPARAAASLADQRWWELFEDDTLRGLIRTALERNYDVRIAAARLLEAEAQLGATRADQLPTVSAQLAARDGRLVAGSRSSQPFATTSAELGVSWEIDFWGKFRHASEAARADVLATEWGRRAAVQSLIAQVASSYFVLRALDQQLSLASSATETRRESLRLTIRREQSGAGSLLDVRQAEELVQLADGERIALARQVEQQENLLSTLLGFEPGPVTRGQTLAAQKLPPAVPAGLPSALLERRPDIQSAEQQLVSATAQVGVARAQRLPSLTLTGSGGVVSGALLALFTSPAIILNAAGSLVQPIFDGGRLSAQENAADARAQQAVLTYQSTVLQALREVSDALVGFQRNRELLVSRDALLEASRQALSLAELRYQGGSSSYLEVLDANTRQLDAEFARVRARLDALLSYVDVYRALGGGWQG